jgi:hypothetical protein
MQLNGRIAFTVWLILIASYVVYSASYWSFKTGFFPMAIAIPLIILCVIHLYLELFGGPEKTSGPAVEAEFSQEVPPEVARRRVTAIFCWIAGFILLVYLAGFPLAVPLFIFLYLTMQSQVNWLRSLALTGAAWGFFYIVFQRVVRLQFQDGIIQTWLGL